MDSTSTHSSEMLKGVTLLIIVLNIAEGQLLHSEAQYLS